MKTSFIPVDYDYFDFQGKNYAKIIGRNFEGKRICIIDSCPVYLWAILQDKTPKSKIESLIKKYQRIKLNSKGRSTKVEKIEIHEKNFLDKKVKALKIFATNYKDLHEIADKLSDKEILKRRGYDLGFITHYIIERKLFPLKHYEIEGEMLNNSDEFGGIDSNLEVDFCIKAEKINPSKEENFKPKVLAYDIETSEFELGRGEILMISLYGENFKKVLTCKNPSKKSFVEKFSSEKELLEAFVENVKKYSPDILTGYFSDGFDLPYLRARADKHKIKLNLGLDNSVPTFSRGNILTGKIKGIVHVDLLRFIRNAYSQYLQSETLSLNEVSSEFLGEKKIDLDPLEEAKIKKTDWEKFYEYNLKDSELTYRLFEKIWPDLSEITSISQEPLFNTSRSTMASAFESYVLHNLNKYNEIPERSPHSPEIGRRRAEPKYEGAFVFEPKPGLYEDIVFFDFSSMYASVIISYNLSKSTQTENKKNSNIATINKEKIYFSKQTGFIPDLLKNIIEKRRKFKNEYHKNPSPTLRARSNAFKLIANAAYGYQGFFGARYYSLEAAASTAYFARQNIKNAIENFKKANFKVVYSDTDSVAIVLEKHSKKSALETLKKINEELPGVMELELEGFFKRGIWVTKRSGKIGAKKKYALIDEKGNIKIRGFETVRRDWCNLSRKLQNKVLELVLKDGDEKKALDYTKKIILDLKNRKIEKKDLIIRTQLKKDLKEYKSISPHVVAAKKMKEQNIPISQGNLIEYYLAKQEKGEKSKLVREKVKLVHEPGDYDIEYYLDRQVLPAIENIFHVFGIEIKEIIENKKQDNLQKWF